MLGAVCPMSQNSPASLKGGDDHPHFTVKETKVRVGRQGEAQPSLLVPEPSPEAGKLLLHSEKCRGHKN